MKNKAVVREAFLSLDCSVHEGGSQSEVLRCRETQNGSMFLVVSGSALEEANLSKAVLKLKKRGKPHTFVIESGGPSPEALKTVEKRYKAKLTIEGEPFHRLEELVLEAEGVYLPSLSLKVAAKLANGIVDEFLVAFLWACLMKKTPVYASEEALLKTYQEAPSPMKAQLEQYLEVLKSYGVVFVSEFPDLKNAEEGSKPKASATRLTDALSKQVITERHIMGLEKGTKLLVGKSVRVTPLAKDMAKSRRIEFVLE